MDSSNDAASEAWTLLFQLFRSQKREMSAIYAELQLNPAQVHLLTTLEEDQAMPMKELADSVAFDASYVTGLVDKLEQLGLTRREPSPADRRVKLISLTPEGAAARGRVIARFSQPPPFIAALSPEDQAALRDIFRRAAQATTPAD
jgi:DNA-binding MarR family transcriptional regulator